MEKLQEFAYELPRDLNSSYIPEVNGIIINACPFTHRGFQALAMLLILGLGVWASCGSGEPGVARNGASSTRLVTVSVSSDVSIVEDTPSQLSHAQIIPQHVVLYPGEVTTFASAAYDQRGRELQGVQFHWQILDPAAGNITSGGVFNSAFNTGTFNDALLLVATPPAGSGAALVEATASITIIDAFSISNPVSIRVLPDQVNLLPGEQFQLLAYALDLNGTVVPSQNLKWDIVEPAAGTISPGGLLRAGSEVGAYPGAVHVKLSSEGGSPLSEISAITDVNILDPDKAFQEISAVLLPSVISVRTGQEFQFNVLALDERGNQLEPEEVTWGVENISAGTINQRGRFKGGETADIYSNAVTAIIRLQHAGESIEVNAVATVVLVEVPDVISGEGRLQTVAIFPQRVTLSPGESTRISVVSIDGNGHQLVDLAVSWSLDPRLGRTSPTGNITAADSPGIYEGAITVKVSQEEGDELIAQTVSASLIIRGELARVETIPQKAILTPGEVIRFRAIGYDRDDTPVTRVTVRWNVVDPEAGSIDSNGVFTAGRRLGEFSGAVVAEMSQRQ